MKQLLLFALISFAYPAAWGQAAPAGNGADSLVLDVAPDTPGAEDGKTLAGTEKVVNSALIPGARFTLKQELASKIKRPFDSANVRTSFRAEYEKHFIDTFYLRLDGLATAYVGRDHVAKARDQNVVWQTSLREAFLQFSKGDTSVKLGRQILIWGESEAGVITDVIAPRNFSELVFVSLEASRLSQTMLTVDQYTKWGDFNLFYIPKSRFNKYPEPNTSYYFDPFQGTGNTSTNSSSGREYGVRWRKAFSGGDLSVMAASLMDNDYALSLQGFDRNGLMRLRNEPYRFKMVGATFSRTFEGILLSGEVAKKIPRSFIDGSNLQTVKKSELDTAIKAEYSLGNGGNHAVSLEVVNKRILDWDSKILPSARNTNSLVLGWRNAFWNDTLNVNFLSVYNQTYPGFQHSLFMDYKLNSNVSLNLDLFYLHIKDKNNELYQYRGQNKAVFRVAYQF